ncbi:hypothetical protein CE143_15600 [Photorhabdus luminescens]|uniref:Uncharacterized protein n=1 Tax=Photorhabdus akhurstii TaxID=171438 RepID=A0ABX8LYL0_9GAMM|nr:hypothetical protein B0X70_15605 [Photorhabdus akhurstii]UJD76240.1 hypothetical protein CE143_15600 [Photorhabdus luminescens]
MYFNRFFGPCPPPGLPVNVMVNNLKALRAFRLISPPALGEGLRRILLKGQEVKGSNLHSLIC